MRLARSGVRDGSAVEAEVLPNGRRSTIADRIPVCSVARLRRGPKSPCASHRDRPLVLDGTLTAFRRRSGEPSSRCGVGRATRESGAHLHRGRRPTRTVELHVAKVAELSAALEHCESAKADLEAAAQRASPPCHPAWARWRRWRTVRGLRGDDQHLGGVTPVKRGGDAGIAWRARMRPSWRKRAGGALS